MNTKSALTLIAPVVVAVLVVVAWDLFIRISGVPSIVMPAPEAVVKAVSSQADVLMTACRRTASAACLGLTGSLVLGVVIACLFSQSKLARTALYPYAILLQTIPIIAVAPIVVVTLGRGFGSVALISMIISIFPVITNTTTGLLLADRNLLELFRLHSATWWQRLWKLQLPGALPYVISGTRIAGGSAIVGAIVGEFFVGSSNPGLGSLIQQKSAGIHMDQLYATVFVSTLLGVFVFASITLCGEFVLRRFFGMSLSGVR